MLKIGQTFSATVRDIASDGRAVVTHPNGQAFFVSGLWLDESGEFRITGLKGRLGFAEILSVDESSLHPDRVAPACSYHGYKADKCGGCPWQFINYEAQLKLKQQKVEQALAKVGITVPVDTILASDTQFEYRNRAQFKTDGQALGYVAQASNSLVDVDVCPILTKQNQQTLTELRKQLPKREWQQKPAKKGRQKGRSKKGVAGWTSIDIDESVSAESASINKRLPFQQANSQQNIKIQQWLLDSLKSLPQADVVVELFCGSGNLTEKIIEAGVKQVYAVEGSQESLSALEQKSLKGVVPLLANLYIEQGIAGLAEKVRDAQVLVLDPPRDGFKIKAPFFPKKSKIEDIFYISCNLATFTRDVAELVGMGFEAIQVQPLDQFPHTPHIELMAHLKRRV